MLRIDRAPSSLAWDVVLATGLQATVSIQLRPMTEDDDLTETMQFTSLHLITAGLGGRISPAPFLRHSSTLEARDGWGRTPLHWAAIRRQPELVESLLSAGANPQPIASGGDTPLHLLAWGVEDEACLRCTDMILRAGANPNVLNMYGQAALHAAAWEHREPHRFIGLLLENGAQTDIRRSSTDDTSLHQAIAAGSLANVQFLVTQGGADIELPDDCGRTSLLRAVRYNRAKIIKWLLERGAKADVVNGRRDHGPESILHVAARYAELETLQALVKNANLKGVDSSLRDRLGLTAARVWQESREDKGHRTTGDHNLHQCFRDLMGLT